MIEKVLGFKEKDSWNVLAVNEDKIFAVNSNNLVPVVSVEELEKIIERKRYMEAFSAGKQEWVVNVESLLSTIHKQSESINQVSKK